MPMSNVIHILTRRPLELDGDLVPGPRECVACFVRRMTDLKGCSDELSWVEHWRALRCQRATALGRRLQRRGGMCDCAVVSVVWRPVADLWQRDSDSGAYLEPDRIPECLGVRPNSTQACAQWADPEDVAL